MKLSDIPQFILDREDGSKIIAELEAHSCSPAEDIAKACSKIFVVWIEGREDRSRLLGASNMIELNYYHN